MSRPSRYLDLSLNLHRKVRTRVIERPGLWMAEADKASLLAQLRLLVERGIGDDLAYGILSGDDRFWRNAVITVLSDKRSGETVAFNALSFMPIQLRGRPVEALHLGLVMVDPGYRAQGMSWILYGLTCILMFFRRGLRPLWVSNVTQVPAIVGKVAEAFSNTYPDPFRTTRRSFEFLCVAREIMAHHRAVFGVAAAAGFDEERFVITDAYTGGSDHLKKTFEQAPRHRDERVNALCEETLDYRRGDDFLQIAKLDLPTIRRYLMREVPRHSLPAVLYWLAFLGVGSILLPVWHWLNPHQPMGTLRTRS